MSEPLEKAPPPVVVLPSLDDADLKLVNVSVAVRYQDMGQTAKDAYVEGERARHVEPVRIQEQTKRWMRGLGIGAELAIFAIASHSAPSGAFVPLTIFVLIAVTATAVGAFDGLDKLFGAIADRIKPKQ